MTTIVVVKKNEEIAIASDALVTFGETRLPHGYEVNEKIFSIGDSYIGLAGSTAHLSCWQKRCGTSPMNASSTAASRCSRPSNACT